MSVGGYFYHIDKTWRCEWSQGESGRAAWKCDQTSLSQTTIRWQRRWRLFVGEVPIASNDLDPPNISVKNLISHSTMFRPILSGPYTRVTPST